MEPDKENAVFKHPVEPRGAVSKVSAPLNALSRRGMSLRRANDAPIKGKSIRNHHRGPLAPVAVNNGIAKRVGNSMPRLASRTGSFTVAPENTPVPGPSSVPILATRTSSRSFYARPTILSDSDPAELGKVHIPPPDLPDKFDVDISEAISGGFPLPAAGWTPEALEEVRVAAQLGLDDFPDLEVDLSSELDSEP